MMPLTVSLSCRPQYYEIYKYKEVIGISLLFMTVDALGGVFNDLSLAFKGDFDVVAGITYSLVVVRLARNLARALTLTFGFRLPRCLTEASSFSRSS